MTRQQRRQIKRRKDYEKKRNIRRIRRRALGNIEAGFQEQTRYLSRFAESEDPRDLWSEREVRSLADHLAGLGFRRGANGVRHRVEDVLIMVLYATLCGKTDYREIEEWLLLNEDYFTVLLGLEHGVPSDTTIGRVMSQIAYEELHKAFNEWSLERLGLFMSQTGEYELHMAADGKALRALTKKHRGEIHPPYMVNVYVYFKKLRRGLCIASVPVDKKTNESKTLASVVGRYALPGSVVTMDAAGAFQDVIDAARSRGADVLVCVKDNQKGLLNSVKKSLEYASEQQTREAFTIERVKEETGFSQEFSDVCQHLIQHPEIRHGRVESRRYKVSHSLGGFDARRWPDIKTVGCVRRSRRVVAVKRGQVVQGRESEETAHFYVSTREMEVDRFAGLVRGHWLVESRLHGVLDGEAFKEDRARMRMGEAKENMSLLRRMAYNLIELLAGELPEGRSFKNKIQTIVNTCHGLESILFKKVPSLSLERKPL